jgi:hypothetical protein
MLMAIKKPFKDLFSSKFEHSTVLEECIAWLGGTLSAVPSTVRIPVRHIDELRDRVDLSDGPDTVVTFSGGAAVDVPHILGSVPRHWQLLSWTGGALSTFSVSLEAAKIIVTATDGVTGRIALWK